MSNNGFNRLSKAQLDMMAIDILKKYDFSIITESKATDIENFIEAYLGLDIDYKCLSPEGNILGLATFDKGELIVFSEDRTQVELIKVDEGNIIVDTSLLEPQIPEGRLRFTLAHEVAHWILHRDIFKVKSYRKKFTSTDDIAVRDINREDGSLTIKSEGKTKEEWIEWQADYLAGALLMPENIFKYEFQKILREDLEIYRSYLYLDNQECNRRNYKFVISKLANKFKVSKQAARVRLVKLDLLQIEEIPMYASLRTNCILWRKP